MSVSYVTRLENWQRSASSILFTTDRFEETSPCQRAFFFPSWWDRTRFLFSLKNSVSRRKLWQVDVTCREHASVIFPHQEALEVLHMTLRVEGFGADLITHTPRLGFAGMEFSFHKNHTFFFSIRAESWILIGQKVVINFLYQQLWRYYSGQ